MIEPTIYDYVQIGLTLVIVIYLILDRKWRDDETIQVDRQAG